MKLIKKKVSELKGMEDNPRQISPQQRRALKDSLEKFGYVEPIIWNKRTDHIVGGHQRLDILRENKIKEIDVVEIDLDEVQEKALNIALNKISGEWDDEKLKAMIEAIKLKDESLVKFTGFSDNELDALLLTEVKEDDFDVEKAYKQPKYKIKQGEVWQLGAHRLMCGNSESEEDVKILMDGNLARMIFTDPPYNVDYESVGGTTYSSEKFGGKGKKIFNDNKTEDESLKFYVNVLNNLFKFSREDATIYWWFANRNNWINRMAFNESGWKMSQIIIWLKNSMIFAHGWEYHRMYEPCMVGWKKGKSHYCNKKISNLKDCFNLDFTDFNEMLDVWYEKRDVTASYIHPTQKPVRLAERGLKKNSEKGDIIIDLFGRSGSTLIACEQLKRRAFLMELDPKFCSAIVERYESWTGNKGVKIDIKKVLINGKE